MSIFTKTHAKSLVLALIIILSGANIVSSAESKVFTTIYPVYAVAKEICRSVCEVENLIPSGASPHDYQLKPGDLAAAQRSSLVFLCGLGLDNWFEMALDKSNDSKKIRYSIVTKGLEPFLIYEPQSEASNKDMAPNPHFWLDPILMKHVATNIAMALSNIVPEKKDKIGENLKNFSIRMDALDKFINEEFRGVNKRAVICLHNAFTYFGKRYGIEIAGVIEEVPDFPVSPRHLSKLTAIAREKKVSVVFGEKWVSNEIAKRLADELRLPFAVLDTIETGDETGVDYVERMKANVLTIKKFMK